MEKQKYFNQSLSTLNTTNVLGHKTKGTHLWVSRRLATLPGPLGVFSPVPRPTRATSARLSLYWWGRERGVSLRLGEQAVDLSYLVDVSQTLKKRSVRMGSGKCKVKPQNKHHTNGSWKDNTRSGPFCVDPKYSKVLQSTPEELVGPRGFFRRPRHHQRLQRWVPPQVGRCCWLKQGNIFYGDALTWSGHRHRRGAT